MSNEQLLKEAADGCWEFIMRGVRCTPEELGVRTALSQLEHLVPWLRLHDTSQCPPLKGQTGSRAVIARARVECGLQREIYVDVFAMEDGAYSWFDAPPMAIRVLVGALYATESDGTQGVFLHQERIARVYAGGMLSVRPGGFALFVLVQQSR